MLWSIISYEQFIIGFICNGIIFDTFSCSGNILLYNIWLIINVNGFANTYFAVFIKVLEMPSIPLLDIFLNGQSLV